MSGNREGAGLFGRLLVHLGLDQFFDFLVQVRVGLEGFLRGVPALGDLAAVIADPGAALLDDVILHRQVQQASHGGDAFIVHDVELAFREGGRHLVLDHLDLGAVSGYGAVAGLDLADAADVHAHGSVEFQGASAGSGFRVAEHDADFFTDLVGEDADGAGLGDEAGELAEGGGHQARLGAHRGVSYFAFQLLLGDQRGHGVHHDDVNGIGTHQGFADLQGFFPGARLGDQQVVLIHADGLVGLACHDPKIDGVQRQLGEDTGQNGRNPAPGVEQTGTQSRQHTRQKRAQQRGPWIPPGTHQHDAHRAAGGKASVHRQVGHVQNTVGDVHADCHDSPDQTLRSSAWKCID